MSQSVVELICILLFHALCRSTTEAEGILSPIREEVAQLDERTSEYTEVRSIGMHTTHGSTLLKLYYFNIHLLNSCAIIKLYMQSF